MYVEDAVLDLVKTLLSASTQDTEIYIAHGRNRQAEATFKQMCIGSFHIAQLASTDMDDIYQTIDVDVLQLCKL